MHQIIQAMSMYAKIETLPYKEIHLKVLCKNYNVTSVSLEKISMAMNLMLFTRVFKKDLSDF